MILYKFTERNLFPLLCSKKPLSEIRLQAIVVLVLLVPYRDRWRDDGDEYVTFERVTF
jgi:hypothetical protein